MFTQFTQPIKVRKRGNSNLYVDLPKWMFYALGWSNQDDEDETLNVKITAIPEHGELVLHYPKKKAMNTADFVMRACVLKGKNPVKDKMRPKNDVPSIAKIKRQRALDKKLQSELKTEIDYYNRKLQSLRRLQRGILKKQNTQLSVEEEFLHQQAIKLIDDDPERQNILKGAALRKWEKKHFKPKKQTTKKQY